MTGRTIFAMIGVLLLAAPLPADAILPEDGLKSTTDRNGLTWQRQDDGVARNWADALSYCEHLTLAGYSDWRLPNIKELESLTDDRRHTPAIDGDAFPQTKTAGYWSSTSLADNPGFGWFVYFNNGYVNPVDKSHEYYTRCLRGGKVPGNRSK
jgi:hypothetical protein